MLCVASRARRGEKTRVPVVSRRGGGRVGREEADCAFQRLASIPDRRSRRSSPVGRRKTLNQRFFGWAVVFSLSLSFWFHGFAGQFGRVRSNDFRFDIFSFFQKNKKFDRWSFQGKGKLPSRSCPLDS